LSGCRVQRGLPCSPTRRSSDLVLARGLRGGATRLAERVVARTADVVLGASSDLVERARRLGAADARLGPVAAPPLPAPRRSSARSEEHTSELQSREKLVCRLLL